jgi:hypothetical protein
VEGGDFESIMNMDLGSKMASCSCSRHLFRLLSESCLRDSQLVASSNRKSENSELIVREMKDEEYDPTLGTMLRYRQLLSGASDIGRG